MNCLNPSARQRGAALIIAMLVFALATTLVVAMSSEFTLFMKRGANSFIASQAQAYLRGGEDLAGLALLQDAEQDEQEQSQRDDLNEFWAQQVPPYALDEGGWLTGNLVDIHSRLNLNALLDVSRQGGPQGGEPQDKGQPGQEDQFPFTAGQEQFIRLLQVFDEPRVSQEDATLILEALLDWLDEDREPRDFGAEDDYYLDIEPAYLAGNRPMQSVSELRAVAHMTPELFLAVEPYLTVWGNGDINIHTAPPQILRTINDRGDLEPLSEGEGESLLELRGEEGFENMQAFTESQVLNGREIGQISLVESSNWFLYSGEVEVADRVARLYSVLQRDGGKVKAVIRASGSL